MAMNKNFTLTVDAKISAQSAKKLQLQLDQIGSKGLKNLDKNFTKLATQSNKAAKTIEKAKIQTAGLKKNTDSLGQSWVDGFKKFSLWLSISTVFFGIARSIKASIEAVKDLDTAMVELVKITNISNTEQEAFIANAQEIGTSVAATTSEITQATSAFARMGFTIKESLDLAEQAQMLVNIGDGITTVDEASKAIIATLKGFGLEADRTGDVIDKLNELSNNFAVETVDLSQSVERVSASMKAAGNDIDESLALFTSAIEVVQNAQRASTAKMLRGLYSNVQREQGELLEVPKAIWATT